MKIKSSKERMLLRLKEGTLGTLESQMEARKKEVEDVIETSSDDWLTFEIADSTDFDAVACLLEDWYGGLGVHDAYEKGGYYAFRFVETDAKCYINSVYLRFLPHQHP